MKPLTKYLIPAFIGLFAMHSPNAVVAAPIYQPNSNGKSLTTPTAWGASNNVIFMGGGGTTPSPYTNSSDGAAVLGAGIGDPVENVGFQFYVTSLDISEWQEYSASFHLFRDLGCASAIGVGVENVMITNGGDTGKSYYVVYSKGVQCSPFVNEASGDSKLTYSIGVGSGIFGKKSQEDIDHGKGAHGTYVFGNIAYEVAQSFNVITDWNGLNLNAGLSKTFKLKDSDLPIGVTIGVADLTGYSGDGARLIFSVGTGFPF
jgi:hypothetical protein